MGKKSRRRRNTSNKEEPDGLELDQRGDGMYSGTFRWASSKTFPNLPSPETKMNWTRLATGGWTTYLETRGGPPLISLAQSDASLLDALSYPMTILSILQEIESEWQSSGVKAVDLILIGASRKAEQRVLKETN